MIKFSEIFKNWLREDRELIENSEIELAQDFCMYLDNFNNKEIDALLKKIGDEKEYEDKVKNMASCLLSILDYLKLQDKCTPGEKDMCELNNETLSQMMFRKMKAYNISLNEELGFDHLKPIDQKRWYKFNIDDESLYEHNSENNQRTRERLIRMAELGMEIVGVAEFGIEDVMSGLYLEKVWLYSDEEFDDYLDWVKNLILEKRKK